MLKDISKADSGVYVHFPSEAHAHSYFLQQTLCTHSPSVVFDILKNNNVRFSFDYNSFYFCLTGLKKTVYTGVFGFDTNQYMSFFINIRKQIGQILASYGWRGEVFIASKNDEKQIAIIMSQNEHTRCNAYDLAGLIDRYVQQFYEREIFKGDVRFRNSTALSDSLSGYEAIRTGYYQTLTLNNLSFLHTGNYVLTKESVNQYRNYADYPTILDACFELRSYVDEGNYTLSEKHLNYLFLNTIRNSYNLALCDDALSFIKSMLQVRCTVYGIKTETPLDTLCARESYHKVEECVEALLPLLNVLCSAVKTQGSYSKPILSAIYYIKMHFAEYLVLSDVARYVNTNASYLSSKFKEETGYSVRNYINKVRLETAQQLLLSQSCTVAEIARQVSFEDVRYFTRVFKQFAGCTPTEYRNKNRQA